ncbi:hypothetical protein CYMTET_33172 [Cymbomonas tetramitiformis]|uniref:Transcription initiation factor TFIID subunit 8 n=1 Tax=Cymbomonas tetramitiformis TaxID=36881 RepID=A0AAE0FDM7_9CHLO|nr:hypothetical protein CYMTET_33172 [Cymbomonas tetramitiformis]
MYADFFRGVARVAAAQICEGLGFVAVQGSACDALADVLVRYICEVGQITHETAELAGRSEGNVFDVIVALEELGQSIESLREYTADSDEIPFARPLPRLPITRRMRLPPSFAEIGEEPSPHIPSFLPSFPDKHTFKDTKVYEGRANDPRKNRLMVHKERRKGELALLSLQDRTRSSDATANYLTTDSRRWEARATPSNNQPTDDTNPFLAAPNQAPCNLLALPAAEQGASGRALALAHTGTKSDPERSSEIIGIPSLLDAFEPTLVASKSALPGQSASAQGTADATMHNLEGGEGGWQERIFMGGETEEVGQLKWRQGDHQSKPFKFSQCPQARRIAQAARNTAPECAEEIAFQFGSIGADDDEKRDRRARADAIMSGQVKGIVEDDSTT